MLVNTFISGVFLWRMRNFYLTYCASEKLAPLMREMEMKNEEACGFCLENKRSNNCVQYTKRHLIRSKKHEKTLLKDTKNKMTRKKKQTEKRKKWGYRVRNSDFFKLEK